MTSDPRAALSTLVAALETHLELCAVRRGEDDPAVVTAYNRVADAFVAYDDALLDAYGEVTPLDVYSEEDDDADEDDLVDDDERGGESDDLSDDDDLDDDIAEGARGSGYFGLDDDEYDLDGEDAEDDDDDEDGDDGDDDRGQG
ncbi:MAG TPA: hypothetical protein VK045_05885 [Ornithinicoccus sp.]|nr:hypothetical protein [Ornithinicoccus sp.]